MSHLVNVSNESHTRWPSPWPIALAVIVVYQLALGWRHAEDIAGDPVEALPFILAGLGVVAGIGLVAGGRLGRIVAGLVAVAGAGWALLVALDVAARTIADPSLDAWGFLAIFLAIAAGYALVLVRAVQGR